MKPSVSHEVYQFIYSTMLLKWGPLEPNQHNSSSSTNNNGRKNNITVSLNRWHNRNQSIVCWCFPLIKPPNMDKKAAKANAKKTITHAQHSIAYKWKLLCVCLARNENQNRTYNVHCVWCGVVCAFVCGMFSHWVDRAMCKHNLLLLIKYVNFLCAACTVYSVYYVYASVYVCRIDHNEINIFHSFFLCSSFPREWRW